MKSKALLLTPGANRAIGLVACPNRRVRMRQVGDLHLEIAQADFERFERSLVLRDELLELFAPLDERLPLFLVGDLGDLGGDFFLLVAVLVAFDNQLAALPRQLDEPGEIDGDVAVAAIFLDEGLILTDELQIEHRCPSVNQLSYNAVRKRLGGSFALPFYRQAVFVQRGRRLNAVGPARSTSGRWPACRGESRRE